MDLKLVGRVILVVGGHGFIGRAVVAKLTEEGATALPASRRITEKGIELDTRDDTSVSAAIANVLKRHGRLDGVVITAAPALGNLDPARSSEPANVLEAIDAKAISFFRVATAALPAMVESGYGRVVGVAGQYAFITGSVAGSVRNAALVLTAKNLADSVAGTGVTVNTVSPGSVRDDASPKIDAWGSGESTPDDTANLIAYLISPLGGAVSGESIAVGHRIRGTTSM